MKISLHVSCRLLSLVIFTIFIPFLLFAQWESPVTLSPLALVAQLNEDAGPCLAVSGDTLHVVWSDRHPTGSAIYYCHSLDAGLTWSVAIPLTDTTGKASMPAIAVAGSVVHIVWMDTLNGIRASYYKRSLDGGITWGGAVCLDVNTKFWPGVAVSGPMVFITLNKEVATNNTEVFLMRSSDYGTTWEAEQQISNANGRSEDPAIAVRGSFIHLSWNDNRTDTMQIFYRRSGDSGATWGPETKLSATHSYTSMICLYDSIVDIPFGNTGSGNIFNVFLMQSADTGSTFGAMQELTFGNSGDAYPYMVRDSSKLHLVYLQFAPVGEAWYLHSGDGGITWDPAFLLGNGGQPFIAFTGCILHTIWPDNGKIYYRRNPTGNCGTTSGITMKPENIIQVTAYPNPFSSQTTIEILSSAGIENGCLKVFNLLGEQVTSTVIGLDQKIILNRNSLKSGIYFYGIFQKDKLVVTGKLSVD